MLRDRLFFGAIGLGIVHGSYLILRSEPGADEVQEQFHSPTSLARSLPPGTKSTVLPPSRKSNNSTTDAATVQTQLK